VPLDDVEIRHPEYRDVIEVASMASADSGISCRDKKRSIFNRIEV
jgi:hypothetical protein